VITAKVASVGESECWRAHTALQRSSERWIWDRTNESKKDALGFLSQKSRARGNNQSQTINRKTEAHHDFRGSV